MPKTTDKHIKILRYRQYVKDRLIEILDYELQAYNVSVRKWTVGNGGTAYFSTGKIDIPRPRDEYSLGVAFHEIGHIVTGRSDVLYRFRPTYAIEYAAEVFAIERLKFYNLPYREYSAYAKKYVMSELSKYRNKHGNLNAVSREITKWCGIRIREWDSAKTVCVVDTPVKKYSDIILLIE